MVEGLETGIEAERARMLLRHSEAQAWATQYAGFIKVYNQTIAEEGLPLSEWRTFCNDAV